MNNDNKNTSACDLSRRDFLRMGALGAGSLAFGGALAANSAEKKATAAPAKAVIEIWMWGGPSHLDTFDPKPKAGTNYTGPLDKTIKTTAPGIEINAALPLLAKQADKYSIIRSMTHGVFSHETAAYMMRTGREAGKGLVYPSSGAVISMMKGHGKGYTGTLPPYIVLTKPQGRFSESGFLGPQYKPFATGGSPMKTPFTVAGIIAEGVSDKQQKKRRKLLSDLDTLNKATPKNKFFEESDKATDKAYDMILGEERKVFDLSEETQEMRDKYGMTEFGQSCLVARRLIEKGVLYVTINYRGWDTHKQHFNTMQRKLPEFDRGLATLIEDLSDKGLLDSTIVTCMGEFGRSPKVQWAEPWNGGRSHYGHCFSALVAGGGFKGGKVVGESNATGEKVAKRPVYPQDLIGSIYELMGVDPDGLLPNSRGLKLSVLPPAKGGRLKEIMKKG